MGAVRVAGDCSMRCLVFVSGLLMLSAGLVAFAPAASASSAAADPCVTVYRIGQQTMVACANLRDPDCPVIVHHHNGWISYSYCLPPEPAPSGASAINCVTVYDFPDAGYKLCPTLDNPHCLLWEERTTFIGTERTCLVPRP